MRVTIVAAALLAVLWTGHPTAADDPACAPPPGEFRYRVYHEGDEVGRLAIAVAEEPGATVIRTQIEIEVRALFFIPVLDYRHDSEEIWRDGAFERFAGRTVDNGREHVVVVEPDGEALLLEKEGDPPAQIDATLLSWTVWCEAALTRGRLLNPLKGRTKVFTTGAPVTETLAIEGQSLPVRRLDVVYGTPDGSDQREGAVWYGADGVVVKFTFETKRGTMATLVRVLPAE